MTATERIAELRAAHRANARTLADLGVPPDAILADTRAGIEQAVHDRARAGR